MGKLDSPFKDATVMPAGFNIKETLGNMPGQPQDGSQVASISGKVSPKELPCEKGDLYHGS